MKVTAKIVTLEELGKLLSGELDIDEVLDNDHAEAIEEAQRESVRRIYSLLETSEMTDKIPLSPLRTAISLFAIASGLCEAMKLDNIYRAALMTAIADHIIQEDASDVNKKIVELIDRCRRGLENEQAEDERRDSARAESSQAAKTNLSS